MANRIFIPSVNPDSWRQFLADPDKQWKTGYSARALAYCWEEADGFPAEVQRVFSQSSFTIFHDAEMLFGIPEHKVKLPGNGPDSQNDLFVLARSGCDLICIAVEGKAAEPFGNQTVDEWLADASANRHNRIGGLSEIINLPVDRLRPIRYQLIHRTASALLEARRFTARHALMLVHSFSQQHQWFEDYASFARLFGQSAVPDAIVPAGAVNGIELYLGWVTGNAAYLAR